MKLISIAGTVALILTIGSGLLPKPLAGGTVTGKITAKDPHYRPVVWIEGAETGDVPELNTVITHISGKLDPPVSIGYVGSSFVFRNDDPEFHNTHLYLHLDYQKKASTRPLYYGATLYNIPLPIRGKEIRKPIKPYHRYREETGFIEVVCNPHPDEKAYVMVFDHSFCDIVAEDGSYSIEGIPPGKYPVRVFYGGDISSVAEVEVLKDRPVTLDLELD